MERQNCIDHHSICVTIAELNKIGDTTLAEKLNSILKNNELPKADKHNKKADLTTSYYSVTLNAEELETLEVLFLELEVQSLDKNYDTTNAASLYSDIGSKWSSIEPV
ncbi:MAG: hypothetical protein KAZ71_03390 [Bacteroidia bacterium]|nr:hypothetical protein [Bacteroidia bacterium]